jgi:mono/diheme cytochrome c family protein
MAGEGGMNAKLGGAAMACLVFLTTSAGADERAEERGRAIAEGKCARCHAITAEGESPMALAPPFRLLPGRYPVEHLAEALAEGIVVGHPAMPEFTFNPPEIDALLSYLQSLSSGDRSLPPKR